MNHDCHESKDHKDNGHKPDRREIDAQELLYHQDALRLETVTTCVGFDDMLDVTLTYNHAQVDNAIIITSHDDIKTQMVVQKHGARLVLTDLFKKNNRQFNKGAAINSGFGHFQYHGWRLHLDADIVLPDNFKRILFNHTHLDRDAIYGCDRLDVVGVKDMRRLMSSPQHGFGYLVMSKNVPASARYVDGLRGYVPIGFFQLWHASKQIWYPYSLGTAAHDDILFAEQWPSSHRRHLPTVICYHLQAERGKMGENWEGRGQKRLDLKD
jgi:glycosyltransferase involved in cell wall biosynthesis